MKIVVSSEGPGLAAKVSSRFGRCPVYVFIDTDTKAVESVSNPAQNAAGGAGVQAAQYVASKGVQAALTGNVGPNANDVLSAAGIEVFIIGETTVGQAVKDFGAGKLPRASGATVASHAGTRAGTASPAASREREIAALYAEAAGLRQKLAEITTRIDQLEKEV